MDSITKIFPNPAFHAMRVLVLSALESGGLNFRHHGIGVLQGYVLENSDPEIRIHIWSRRLLKPGMDVSGDIHDHRFDMTSHVLCGSVFHEEIHERSDKGGDYTMMALTHARAAKDQDYHGPTSPLGGRFFVDRVLHQIRQGYSYQFPALKFHRTPFLDDSEVVVTCVEKHRQRDDVQARLLYPTLADPIMAFGHRQDDTLIRSVVSMARQLLGRGL